MSAMDQWGRSLFFLLEFLTGKKAQKFLKPREAMTAKKVGYVFGCAQAFFELAQIS